MKLKLHISRTDRARYSNFIHVQGEHSSRFIDVNVFKMLFGYIPEYGSKEEIKVEVKRNILSPAS